MGCRIIVGKEDGGGGPEVAVLYCSVSGWAFGPTIGVDELADELSQDAHDVAQAFCNYVDGDPRSYSQHNLEELWGRFCDSRKQTFSKLKGKSTSAAT